MEEKVKEFELVEELDSWGYGVSCQEVTDPDTGKAAFSVHNLSECPEDAIIGRNLFNAHDWLRAVNLGIGLAKQGFTSASFKAVSDGV